MKKFLSFILIVSFVLTIIPVSAVTAYAENHTHDGITFDKELDSSFPGGALDGNYVLTSNITLTQSITVASGKTVNLCLNGFVIDANNACRAIENNGTLSIYDCGNTSSVHYYTVSSNGIWEWDDNNTVDAISYVGLTNNPSVNSVIAISGGSITGGHTTEMGGGIYSSGILHVKGASLVGNSSKDGGGVEVWKGTSATFEDCNFIANTAYRAGAGLCFGYNDENSSKKSDAVTVVITGGSFFANRVANTDDSGAGGGISLESHYSVLTMSSVTFNCNYAKAISGAVHMQNDTIVSASDCVFMNNTSRSGGGAIHVNGALTLKDCTLTENICNKDGDKNDRRGGALELNAGSITLIGKIIISGNKNNGVEQNIGYRTSSDNAKAKKIRVSNLLAGSSIGISSELTADVIDITSDTTENYAAYFHDDKSEYTSIYEDNKVKFSKNIVASITTGGSTTYYSSVQNAINAAGTDDTVVILKDVTENVTIASTSKLAIDLNGHVLSGGGVGTVIDNKGELTIVDSNPQSNHYFSYKSQAAWVLTGAGASIAVDDIVKNAASGNTPDGSLINVKGGCITGGTSTNGGGINNTSTVHLNGGTLVGNTADSYGGAINNGSKFYISGASIIGNYSQSGNIYNYLHESELYVSGSSICYNQSFNGGAGIRSHGTLVLEDTSVSYNCHNSTFTGQCDGGAAVLIYVDTGGTMVASNCAFNNNKGGVNGGALCLENQCIATLSACRIENNISGRHGGGIFAKGDITLIDTIIKNNTGSSDMIRGGGLLYEEGSITISGSTTITDNTYIDTHGAIAITNNVYFKNPGKFIVADDFAGKIGVTSTPAPIKNNPVQITYASNADYSQYFESDLGYVVKNTGTDANQNVILAVHEHDWIYSAVGDTLIASCNGLGTCNAADVYLVVSASSVTYDGNEHSAIILATKGAVSGATSFCGDSSLPTITYEKQNGSDWEAIGSVPSATGIYKAIITKDTVSASAIYEITKESLAAPTTLEGVAETIKGKCDGKISGASIAMEYSAESPLSYNAITGTEVTGLAAGTYKVRFKATEYYNASSAVDVVVSEGTPLKVSFDSVGGSSVATKEGISWHGVVTEPEITTRAGSTLEGWYTSDGAVFEFNTPSSIEADTTLIANWSISSGAVVEVDNEYNQNETKTRIQVISSYGALASRMENEATVLKQQELSKSILLRVTSEKKEENQMANSPVESIKATAGAANLEFHEITATEYVHISSAAFETGTVTNITEAAQIIEVIIPFDTTSKTGITIYRYHGGSTQKFIESKTGEDGTFYIKDGKIHLFTKKFSPYAVGYTEVNSNTPAVYDDYDYDIPAEKKCKQDETCVYAKFIDSDTHAWYHNGVHFCTEKGYIDGEDETHFNPNGTLTRGMMVRLLYNYSGRPEVKEASTFTDVETGRWFTDAIAWAEDYNVVEGDGEGHFYQSDYLTREQLATIFYNFAKFKGYNVTLLGNLNAYSDKEKISDWAVDAFIWANAKGIVSGYNGELKPQGLATRAEAAVLLQQFVETFVK